jgi:hypothetical protein
MNVSKYWMAMKTCKGFYDTNMGCCCDTDECNSEPGVMPTTTTMSASGHRDTASFVVIALAIGGIVL